MTFPIRPTALAVFEAKKSPVRKFPITEIIGSHIAEMPIVRDDVDAKSPDYQKISVCALVVVCDEKIVVGGVSF